jgi:nucleoside-diphosphate-sugar epimerase
MRALIVGCGYVGLPLGVELLRLGHEVFGVRRPGTPVTDLAAVGIQPVAADITDPATLHALPPALDWVINCVSSSRGGVGEFEKVYLEGTRHLLDRLAAEPIRKFVYTSSTSVYGQTDGGLVKESSPTEPSGPNGKILVAAEQEILRAAAERKFPGLILRVAGIYGPGRGHLFQQYLKGEARLAGRGERLINMIHRDDLVGAIVAALKNGRAGEIYNAVDDEPVPQIHFFRWLSETLGKWMPPEASESEMAGRKRTLTHKKVSNRRLKMELGYPFKYPTFRQGYTAEIIRLERAGELNIQPDPR